MSWITGVLDELSDVLRSSISQRLNAYFYEDEDKHEYGPEDEGDPEGDPSPDPWPPDPDYRGPDISLHFNAPPGEYDDEE